MAFHQQVNQLDIERPKWLLQCIHPLEFNEDNSGGEPCDIFINCHIFSRDRSTAFAEIALHWSIFVRMRQVAFLLPCMFLFSGVWAETAVLDTSEFRQWGHDEWKAYVFSNPPQGRDFARAKLDVLLREQRDVVHTAYALGLAEYLLGRHLLSNNWYQYALEQPALVGREGLVWSDEEVALRKESALHNNIGINYEIMKDWVAAENAYARSRAIDLQLGETDAAWLTAINIGLLRFRENQPEEARRLLSEAVQYFTGRRDELNKGRALLNLSVAEQPLTADPLLATRHAQEAYEIFEALGDSAEAVRALITLAQILDARGEQDAMGEVLREIERISPHQLTPQAAYSGIVLRASHARHRKDWQALDSLLLDIEALSEQYFDLPLLDLEFEVRMAAALAQGEKEAVFAIFREHKESLREQFGNKSASLLAEAWEVNDREAQLHRNEQLQLKLRFAERLNWFSALTLLLVGVAVALFLWKKRSDLRNQLVIVRLIRRHLARRPGQSEARTSESQLHEKGTEVAPATPGFQELYAAIEDLVTREGIHRISNISLVDIASKLNSNARYVSQAIRQETSMSYPEYMNMLRVRDAQQLMLEQENQGLSLDQIADLCGFGTRRTFYRQFTKFTGMPPGQFMKLSEADRAAHIKHSGG